MADVAARVGVSKMTISRALRPDRPAFGALSECQRRGWRVHEQLTIAGCGGFEVGEACHSRMSTLAIDCAGMGRAAGELLLRVITAARDGRRLDSKTILVPYKARLRDGT